jgi:hypothetical protein
MYDNNHLVKSSGYAVHVFVRSLMFHEILFCLSVSLSSHLSSAQPTLKLPQVRVMSMYAASSMICALPDEPLQRPFHVLMPHFLALLNDLIRAGEGAFLQRISNHTQLARF